MLQTTVYSGSAIELVGVFVARSAAQYSRERVSAADLASLLQSADSD